MSETDKEIWENYKRHLIPVVKKKRVAKVTKPAPEKAAARKSAEKISVSLSKIKTAIPLKKEVSAPVLERTREKKMKQGDIDIDAKLDLHGMTQARAFDALADFMCHAVKNRKRYLLIITGKGRNSKGVDGAGVLRNNLETWLAQLPEAASILAIRPASPKHGGGGAFYVLLRKN